MGKKSVSISIPTLFPELEVHEKSPCEINLDEEIRALEECVNPDYPKFTSIDLFSGCGGMSLGFKMAGVKSILATDIDENAGKTFMKNFPEVPFIVGDVCEFQKKDIDTILSNTKPDLIIGGPPCQGFSLANKRRNKIKDDPRNKLFYHFLKFIEWYKPKAFVMENVKGLLSMHKGEVIKTILEEFSKVEPGYRVSYRILKASDFHVPQNRERVIIIGIRQDLNIAPEFPKPLGEAISVDMAISDLPLINAGEGLAIQEYGIPPSNPYQLAMRINSQSVKNHIAMKHSARLIDRFKAIRPGESLADVWDEHGSVKRGEPTKKSDIVFSQNNQRVFADKPAPTIAASFQSNFIHPRLNRNFTAREGARLQSFPDNFVFEGMRTKMSWEKGLSQYQQIGNAVPVFLAYHIAKNLLKQLS